MPAHQEVKKGRFREDLYFRIAVFELEVPPLRARDDDVIILAERFLDRYKPKGQPRRLLSREVVDLLKAYNWPGNVRELENIVQRCLLIVKGNTIEPDDLPPRLSASEPDEGSAPSVAEPVPPVTAAAAAATSTATAGGSAPRLDTLDLKELERRAIKQALVEANGNLSQVVRILGIGRTTLYRKLKAHKLRD